MEMTPFKTKILVDQYENMGYELKTGDKLFAKSKDGHFNQYCELLNFDTATSAWLGKGGSFKSFPVTKVNHYIEIVVIPFDQYLKKMRINDIR